jgi:hypothetical protein
MSYFTKRKLAISSTRRKGMENDDPVKRDVGAPGMRGTAEYKSMPVEAALRELGSSLGGLSEAEVEKRLARPRLLMCSAWTRPAR